MALYSIKITNYDNTVLKEMEVAYGINLIMLLPFSSPTNEGGKLISIELINNGKKITRVFVTLEYLLLATETIGEYFSSGNFNTSINSTPKNESNLQIEDLGNLADQNMVEQTNSKNIKALEFYTKSKWRKYFFSLVIIVLLGSIFFRAINDFKKGTALSIFSGGGMVFIMLFVLVAALIIIKKIQTQKVD